MPESSALPTPASPPQPAPQPAAERKPWHAPTLTQVTLEMTGLLSGEGSDQNQSSASQ